MANAKNLIVWISTKSTQKALLHVVDGDLSPSDPEYERFEIAEYDPEEDRWKTIDTIDYVDEILDYGIPQKTDD